MNESVPYKIKYELYPDDDMIVARCLDIDVASDGATEEEALENLREAIELYFERNAEAALGEIREDDDASSDEDALDD
ncbi:MAG: hypothetical protein Q8S26_15095 [Azonexus sp.]|nr:hypothetical protein [Azonexus sp.]